MLFCSALIFSVLCGAVSGEKDPGDARIVHPQDGSNIGNQGNSPHFYLQPRQSPIQNLVNAPPNKPSLRLPEKQLPPINNPQVGRKHHIVDLIDSDEEYNSLNPSPPSKTRIHQLPSAIDDKRRCMITYNLQDKTTDETHARMLKLEINKLQDLVQVLRDQQYILNILNDIDGKSTDPKNGIEHSLIKHLKSLSKADNATKAESRTDDELPKITNRNHHDANEIVHLKHEVESLKELLNNPNFDAKLKTQGKEIDVLKGLVEKLSNQNETQTEPTTNKTPVATMAPVVRENKTKASANHEEEISEVLQELNQFKDKLEKFVASKNEDDEETVGAFLIPNTMNRRPEKEKPRKIDHHRQPQFIPITTSNKTRKTATTQRRAKTNSDVETLLELLSKNEKSNSLELPGDDLETLSEAKINKLLKSLDKDSDAEADVQSRIEELEKLVNKKKTASSVEEQLKKLERKLKDKDFKSKSFDDDDDDPQEELRKLREHIKKLNKKVKIESKSLDDDDDVESQLKTLQKAIKGLQAKEEFDVFDDPEEKDIGVMLNKFISTGVKKKLTLSQIQSIKKKLIAMKGHGGGVDSGDDEGSEPVYGVGELISYDGGHTFENAPPSSYGAHQLHSGKINSYPHRHLGNGYEQNHLYGGGTSHGGVGYPPVNSAHGFGGNLGYGSTGAVLNYNPGLGTYGSATSGNSGFGYGPGAMGGNYASATPGLGYGVGNYGGGAAGGNYASPTAGLGYGGGNSKIGYDAGLGYGTGNSGLGYSPGTTAGLSYGAAGFGPATGGNYGSASSGLGYSAINSGLGYGAGATGGNYGQPNGAANSKIGYGGTPAPAGLSYSAPNMGLGYITATGSGYGGPGPALSYGGTSPGAGTTSYGGVPGTPDNGNPIGYTGATSGYGGVNANDNSYGMINNLPGYGGNSIASGAGYGGPGYANSVNSGYSSSAGATGSSSPYGLTTNPTYASNSAVNVVHPGTVYDTSSGTTVPNYAPAATSYSPDPAHYGTNYNHQELVSNADFSHYSPGMATNIQSGIDPSNQIPHADPTQYPQYEQSNHFFPATSPYAAPPGQTNQEGYQEGAAANAPSPPQPYANPQQNPNDYTQAKVTDLKHQIYDLQNIISTFNKPEYLQNQEDKETVYKLDKQINDLKAVINNLTQDYPNGATITYQNPPPQTAPPPPPPPSPAAQEYQPNNAQPVQYPQAPTPNTYPQTDHAQPNPAANSYQQNPATYSAPPDKPPKRRSHHSHKTIQKREICNYEETPVKFIIKPHSVTKRDTDEESDALQTLTSLFGEALLDPVDRTTLDFNPPHFLQPNLLNDVTRRIASIQKQLDYQPRSNPPMYYNYPQPEIPRMKLFKKKDIKIDIFDKIFDKIIDKVISKIGIAIPKLVELFFGANDFQEYMSGNDYGYNGGNYGNNGYSMEKSFRGFGISGFIPMIILKILSKIHYFFSYLQKYKFFKTFLIPALVLLLVAGSVIFLVWWLQPNDEYSKNLEYHPVVNYAQGGYSNVGGNYYKQANNYNNNYRSSILPYPMYGMRMQSYNNVLGGNKNII